MEQWAGQFRFAFLFDFLVYTIQFQTLTDKERLT